MKLSVICCLLFLLCCPIETNAQTVQKGNLTAQTSVPFPLHNKLSSDLQSVFGVTAVTQFLAGQLLQFALKRELGGQVLVKVRTWSLIDLLHGKIKSIEIKVKSGHYKAVPVGNIQIVSSTPIWLRYRKTHDQGAGLRMAILLKVRANLNQDDIAKALSNQSVLGSLRAFKLDLPGLGEQQLTVLEPQVGLADDLVTVKGTLVTVGSERDTGVQIAVSGKPQLEGDARVSLKEIKVASTDIVEPERFAKFLEELINPLVNFQRFDKPNFAIRLDKLTLADGTVHTEGRVLIAPKLNPPQVAKAVPTGLN
jgi:hypothetical protein